MVVPPGQLEPILEAIGKLDADAELRTALVEAAWTWSLGQTVDVQTSEVARFIRSRLVDAAGSPEA